MTDFKEEIRKALPAYRKILTKYLGEDNAKNALVILEVDLNKKEISREEMQIHFKDALLVGFFIKKLNPYTQYKVLNELAKAREKANRG